MKKTNKFMVKVNNLNELILNDVSKGMDLVNNINSWDGSLEYLQVYSMDDFNEIMQGHEPLEIANKIFYGDFNPNHDFFRFNGYANLESLDEYEIREEIIDNSMQIAQRTVELYEEGHLSYLDYDIEELLEDNEDDDIEEGC